MKYEELESIILSETTAEEEEKELKKYVENGELIQTLIPVFIAKDDKELDIKRTVRTDEYKYIHIEYFIGSHMFKSLIFPYKVNKDLHNEKE